METPKNLFDDAPETPKLDETAIRAAMESLRSQNLSTEELGAMIDDPERSDLERAAASRLLAVSGDEQFGKLSSQISLETEERFKRAA